MFSKVIRIRGEREVCGRVHDTMMMETESVDGGAGRIVSGNGNGIKATTATNFNSNFRWTYQLRSNTTIQSNEQQHYEGNVRLP